MISVLARLGTPEIVGQYALAVAASGPILMLTRPQSRSHATNIRVLSLVFALLGVSAVGFLEQSIQERLAILIVVLAQSVEWLAEIYPGRRPAASRILHSCLSVAALAIVTSRSGRMGAGLLAVLIVRLLVLFLYDFRRPRQDATPEPAQTLFAAFATGVPSLFIAHMLGYRLLGIFAAISSLTPAFDVLAGALARAAAPEVSRCYRAGDQPALTRITFQLATSGVLLGLCTISAAILAGPPVLHRLFGPDYAAAGTLLVALAAVAGCGYVGTLLGAVLLRGQDFPASLTLETGVLAALTAACLVLVPRYGLLGAALAVGAGSCARIAGELWLLRSMLRRVQRPVLIGLLTEPVSL